MNLLCWVCWVVCAGLIECVGLGDLLCVCTWYGGLVEVWLID